MATRRSAPATTTRSRYPAAAGAAADLACTLSAGVERERGPAGIVLRRRGFPAVALEGGTPGTGTVSAGRPDADAGRSVVVDRIAAGPATIDHVDAPFLLSLVRLGYADLHVRDGGHTIAVLHFVAPPGLVVYALPERVRPHDLLLIRLTPAGLEAQRAGRPGRIALAAPAAEFLTRLAAGREGLASAALDARDRLLATLMAAAGLLDGAEPPSGWDAIDLAFHARSRHQSLSEPYGPRANRADVRLRVEHGGEGRAIVLPRFDLAAAIASDASFAQVTEERSSNLPTSDAAIPLELVGEMLFRSLRARAAVNGCGLRPYPSGGRVYEIDAYLLVGAVAGVAPGLYRYDPAAHALVEVAARDDAALALLGADAAASTGRVSPPPLLIVLAAHFPGVLEKYAAMSYALVLKHVGIVMHALGLAAHATGLVARPVGGGRADAFAAATGLDPLETGSVGEVAIALRAVRC